MTITEAKRWWPSWISSTNYLWTQKRIQGEVVPEPCIVCGSVDKIHGHHWDYSKPYDVIWYCRKHHLDLHRNLVRGGWAVRFRLVQNCTWKRFENIENKYDDDKYWPLPNRRYGV